MHRRPEILAISSVDWDSFVIGVASSLVAALVVFLFGRSRGWFFLNVREIGQFYSFTKRLRGAGFHEFYASREEYVTVRKAPKLIDYVSTARSSVKICAFWMSHGNEVERIADDLAQLVRPPKQLKLDIAIINPSSACIGEIASYMDMTVEDLRGRVIASLRQLAAARQQLSPQEQKQFVIRVYTTIPAISVIMIDPGMPDGKTQIELKAYRVPRQYSLGFELRGQGKSAYKTCTDAWCKMIENSEIFDPAKHL